jgi:tetratricopeptide (TPR) repeat protein
MATAAQTAVSGAGRRLKSREAIFLLCVLSLLTLFVFTAFVSRMYHKKVHTMADDWFASGDERYQAKDYKAALTDYQNALVYSPNNPKFQFHLAEAFAANGQYDQARPYLLTLLSDSPGSGPVNLQLARIAVRDNSLADALRYYQGAIYGEWADDSLVTRWDIRREFCDYLITKGAINQATPAVMDLLENTPTKDVAQMKEVGQLLLETRQWARAQQVYRSLLAANRFDEEAIAGAGRAAFELGEFAEAVEDFNRLSPERLRQPDVAEAHEMAHRVLALSPYQSGISAEVRAQRAENALALAEARAQKCASQSGTSLQETPPRTELQIAYATSQAMALTWRLRDLQRFPDRLDAAMRTVFDLENAATSACGETSGDDQALWLLGRSRILVSH